MTGVRQRVWDAWYIRCVWVSVCRGVQRRVEVQRAVLMGQWPLQCRPEGLQRQRAVVPCREHLCLSFPQQSLAKGRPWTEPVDVVGPEGWAGGVIAWHQVVAE